MSKLLRYAFLLLGMLTVLFLINLTLIVTHICNFSVWYTFETIVLGTLFLMAIDAAVAFFTQRVPRKWLIPNAWCFKVFGFERRLYEKVGIRKWKDSIPELGGAFKKFSKQHLESNSKEYIHFFIVETIYGEMAHTWAIVFGIIIFFIFPSHILNFALPLFLINLFLNLLPAMIQRYTRPKLCKVYERMLEKESELAKENELAFDEDVSMLPNKS